MKKWIKLGATAAITIFAAKAAHSLAGSPTGILGAGAQIAGGAGGLVLASKIAK